MHNHISKATMLAVHTSACLCILLRCGLVLRLLGCSLCLLGLLLLLGDVKHLQVNTTSKLRHIPACSGMCMP